MHQAILLNTLPKSGSVYIRRTLEKLLDKESRYVGNGYGLIDQINFGKFREFYEGNYISQNHLAPSEINLRIIKHFNAKMVIHVRKPAEALLSWIHHIGRITGGDPNSEHFFTAYPLHPDNYFEMSLSEKIDWHLQYSLPRYNQWILDWYDYHIDHPDISLFTTYDELFAEDLLINKILSFYGIDKKYAHVGLEKSVEESHFRRGDPNEWREVFTRKQVRYVYDHTPRRLKNLLNIRPVRIGYLSALRWNRAAA